MRRPTRRIVAQGGPVIRADVAEHLPTAVVLIRELQVRTLKAALATSRTPPLKTAGYRRPPIRMRCLAEFVHFRTAGSPKARDKRAHRSTGCGLSTPLTPPNPADATDSLPRASSRHATRGVIEPTNFPSMERSARGALR